MSVNKKRSGVKKDADTSAGLVRLQRYLSQSGVASRRASELLITEGRVRVNGKVVTELGTKVRSGQDRVSVDGEQVQPLELFYLVLNKPKGCVSTVHDPEGRQTVMEYVLGAPPGVVPVGRLDYNSEGVLLMTNDGELANRLLSPQRHVAKVYHVKFRGEVSANALKAMREGVVLDDRRKTKPAEITRLKAKSKHTWFEFTLTEGKRRQIHRMAEAVGHSVSKIQRVAFGPITFHGLRVGDARELTQAEVNELRGLAGLKKTSVSRGKWSVKREKTDLPRRRAARARSDGDAAKEMFKQTKKRPRPKKSNDAGAETKDESSPSVKRATSRGKTPRGKSKAAGTARTKKTKGRPKKRK